MSVIMGNGPWRGIVDIPVSKSVAHRVLIALELERITSGAGIPDRSVILGRNACDDVRMTAAAVRTIVSAALDTECSGMVTVDCGASGTTLRFLMPVAGALGVQTRFLMDEGLAVRPHDNLVQILSDHGCHVEKGCDGSPFYEVTGKLQPGDYAVPGNISSQYISGLMFALPLLEGKSTVTVTGRIESFPYIELTAEVLGHHGVAFSHFGPDEDNSLSAPDMSQTVFTFEKTENIVSVSRSDDIYDGDWSSAAYFFAAMKLSEKSSVLMRGLKDDSVQGDKKITELLGMFRVPMPSRTIDITDVPDLAPVLSVVAAGSAGVTVFTGARRLHFKESDRVESIISLITGIGGRAEAVSEDSFVVYGYTEAFSTFTGNVVNNGCRSVRMLRGGVVDPHGDHRIAMAAAVASLICSETVTIMDESCVSKSYPGFFDVVKSLGGNLQCEEVSHVLQSADVYPEISGVDPATAAQEENGRKPQKAYKVIDFHTHIFNDRLAEAAFPKLKADAEGFYSPVHDMKRSSLISRMDDYGVDMSVILPVITKRKQVEPVNLWALSQASDRIHPFGGIYPNSDDWRDQIDYVKGLGLKGIKFHAEYQDFILDEPGMLRIYDYALSKGMIIIHHAGFDPAYPAPYRTSPKQFAAMADRLRGGVIIAAHLGGSRQWDEVEEYLVGKNIYLDTSMGLQYYPSEQFMRIVRAHGADKILFATDSPWTGADRELEILRSLPLTDQEREMILHLNAERILGL